MQSNKYQIVKCVTVFLLILGTQLGLNMVSYANVASADGLLLVSALISVIVVMVFVKNEGGKLDEYGFLIPENFLGHLSFSVSLALIYVIFTVFLRGAFSIFEAYPYTSSLLDTFTKILIILIANTGIEIVFRGYIFTKINKLYGFFLAASVTSILHTTYYMSIQVFSAINNTVTSSLALLLTSFFKSFFLCALFRRTKTFLCTATFSASVISLYYLTPLAVAMKEYDILFMVVPYIFLILLVRLLTVDEEEQFDR